MKHLLFFCSKETGTVLVKATLVFHSTEINADVIKNMFLKAVADGNGINGLKINPKLTEGKHE